MLVAAVVCAIGAKCPFRTLAGRRAARGNAIKSVSTAAATVAEAGVVPRRAEADGKYHGRVAADQRRNDIAANQAKMSNTVVLTVTPRSCGKIADKV